ncbi:hypothetical protein NQ318_002932 [Aromia moschata]|uniref:Uncharacterized protein n=1 Tax=Aromia moschata TaxID=1265417 RepID=A0AAV8XWE2_9CUCU|nr:hypothetical protein NQ318_002932 [Aromia moschata]
MTALNLIARDNLKKGKERKAICQTPAPELGGKFKLSRSSTTMETNFSFIKECLFTFSYPLAHSMSNDEIGDIFKPSNRCFLIAWMLKLLDSSYEKVLDLQIDKDVLGNIVCELGFCTQRKKLPFMTGELPVGEQFYNRYKKNYSEEKRNVVTNEDLMVLCNTNLNLFPMYGDINLIKPSDKSTKIADLEKEIEKIKSEIGRQPNNQPASSSSDNFSHTIKEFLVKLRIDFPKVKAVVETLNKDKQVETKDTIKINPNSADILKKCSEYLKMISQFIKDINIIQDFVEDNAAVDEKEREKISETYNMIQMIFQEIVA